MIQIFNIKTAYGAALIIAAASGSMIASQSHAASAKKRAVTVAKPTGAPAKAGAKSPATADVVITSEPMVERLTKGADGKDIVTLKSAKGVIIVPGDTILFTLKYQNRGAAPATGVSTTNPMPAAIQFVDAQQAWADVSVDGGVTWGKLTDLTVKEAAAAGSAPVERAALAKDVTHVRWIFADAIAPGAKGSVSYRGLVK